MSLPPPEECANCGALIPPGARACPECGADERTGWRETDLADGLDLPDAADGTPEVPLPRRPRHELRWYWLAAAVLLALLLVMAALNLR
jgi:predicted nucleic acid-binding Zn ribbon protein